MKKKDVLPIAAPCAVSVSAMGYWYPPEKLDEARLLAKLCSNTGSEYGSVFVCWYATHKKIWVAHYSPVVPSRDASIDECWVDGEVVNVDSSHPADVTAAVTQYLRSQTKEKQK